MNLLLLGGTGMLGREVKDLATQQGHHVEAPPSAQFDVTSFEDIESNVRNWHGRIEAIVNCTAYTAVDRAESEPDQARALNTVAPQLLASLASRLGAPLVHISTDFVFDGTQTRPYTEDDATNPIGVYGQTKLSGESHVLAYRQGLVLRTSWLFGPQGKSFVRTIARAAFCDKPLRVVNDQIGTPTYAPDLARAILLALEHQISPGLYHAAGPEIMSWHQLAQMTVDEYCSRERASLHQIVAPIPGSEYPTPAKRPAYSALNCSKLKRAIGEYHRPICEALRHFREQLPMENC